MVTAAARDLAPTAEISVPGEALATDVAVERVASAACPSGAALARVEVADLAASRLASVTEAWAADTARLKAEAVAMVGPPDGGGALLTRAPLTGNARPNRATL